MPVPEIWKIGPASPGVRVERRSRAGCLHLWPAPAWLPLPPATAGSRVERRLLDRECPITANRFAEKIRNSGGRDGLLLAVDGLSGNFQSGGHKEIRNQLKKGTRIAVVTEGYSGECHGITQGCQSAKSFDLLVSCKRGSFTRQRSRDRQVFVLERFILISGTPVARPSRAGCPGCRVCGSYSGRVAGPMRP
jgi:hypothetical protein